MKTTVGQPRSFRRTSNVPKTKYENRILVDNTRVNNCSNNAITSDDANVKPMLCRRICSNKIRKLHNQRRWWWSWWNVPQCQWYRQPTKRCFRQSPITLRMMTLLMAELMASSSDTDVSGDSEQTPYCDTDRSAKNFTFDSTAAAAAAEHCNDDDEEEKFLTYDTAPVENRLETLANQVRQYCGQLPGGCERFLCIVVSIFLLLFVLGTQLYIWSVTVFMRDKQIKFIFCLNAPSVSGEVITLECRLKLLISAWLGSMVATFLIVFVHFMYWWQAWPWLVTSTRTDNNIENLDFNDQEQGDFHRDLLPKKILKNLLQSKSVSKVKEN